MLKSVIVDDDELSRSIIKDLVQKTEFLELLGEFDDPMKASVFLNQEHVDLLFLDIEMPEMNGMELIESLNVTPQIILITRHGEYALESYEHNVSDYLLKPINKGRFMKAVSKARTTHEKLNNHGSDQDFMFAKVDSKLVKIDKKEITWVEALGNYATINTGSGKYTVRATMKEMEEKLISGDFIRVHRSFIVRIDKVNQIADNTIDINGKMITIGNAYKEDLLKKLNLL